ncbi:MAG: class I SAM-dependent methyltransferase [Candidatus Binataceae bacterium]|jgi:SAM-dependent methyltransferase
MATGTFIESAELYDAIYGFKHYASEAERLRALINSSVPGARTILDVACGTGEHARFLKAHYAIDGADINDNYLRAARFKNPTGKYARADMTNFDFGRTYDVVTCLFSAIAIVKTFERLEAAVACMARHVRPGGALIIEPWFTPDNWRPGAPFMLGGEIGSSRVYRLSHNLREGQLSVLLHHYLLVRSDNVEHYGERIELGLFSRDEIAWALESAGFAARYDAEGLMGRGLYIAMRDPRLRTDRDRPAEISNRAGRAHR